MANFNSFVVASTTIGCMAAILTAVVNLSRAAAEPSAAQYRELGLQYRQAEQFPEAIAALQKAVELDPTHLPGQVSLGWTQHLAKQDRAAAITLQTTLRQDPFHVPALNALGIVYLVNEDLLGAALTHSWAAWLAPDNEIAYYNLSLAWQRLKHYDWAIEAAQTAAQLEPDNPHPFVALAIAQWQQGNQPTAQQTYQQAINLDSRYAEADFLHFLNEAGFHPQQIQTAQQVLQSL
jgi:tetratricopeptide (TPR) repeat protein